jgi:hypothetical protein
MVDHHRFKDTSNKLTKEKEMETSQQLADILTKYAVPDKSIVGKLPRGGTQLDFVGHADITKILIEIDPLWTWCPCGWENGRPAITVVNGMAVMWASLTVHGKTMLGVGTVKHDKADVDKELVGDFLRNAAMRFGICLSLWTKQEWDDTSKPASIPVQKSPKAPVVEKPTAPVEPAEDSALTQQQVKQFVDACDKVNLDPAIVASKAQLNWEGQILQSQLPLLRDAFTSLRGGN